MHSGDFWGSGGPLTNHEPTPFSNYRAATRQEAVAAAGANLRKSLSKRADEGDRDACAVMSWLDSLNPDQLDLFGAAA